MSPADGAVEPLGTASRSTRTASTPPPWRPGPRTAPRHLRAPLTSGIKLGRAHCLMLSCRPQVTTTMRQHIILRPMTVRRKSCAQRRPWTQSCCLSHGGERAAAHSRGWRVMDLQLSGKTALITGASKGIGRAAAERLAQEGCDVILVSRTATDLAAAKAAIASQSKAKIDTVAADLSQSSSVDRLARDFHAVDILVNNAGAIPGGQLLDIDERTWRTAWDLKVFGYINMCRAYYALMKQRGSGVIINVTGNAAQSHDPEYICGVAGNAALTAFS